MTITRTESRCRIGITWYDTEEEAVRVANAMAASPGMERAIADANIGFVQCGRDPGFDVKDATGTTVEFAVVTP